MRLSRVSPEFDATDRAILELLQEDCKKHLAEIGEKVGLSAPAVAERIHKLEQAGAITGYTAILDARLLGKDVTAFIGVSTAHPRAIQGVERQVAVLDELLECHHVTGAYTLMLKVKTRNTGTLEEFIDRVRSIEGVSRTETMVVLSTHAERHRISLGGGGEFDTRPARRPGGSRGRRSAK